ncbi:MAG: ATP-dependent Clp protease ATP-binding subunit, partial [Victivallales bacterium]|nr:ATP-dependent Clp protease ATP-binding subunit [Victivallales bacterium]
ELARQTEAKEKAIGEQRFEEAAQYRDSERKLKQRIEEVRLHWQENSQTRTAEINEKDMAEIVAKFTGIPVQQMEEGESERLLRMEAELAGTVVGQEDAVSIVSRALRRSRADLKNPDRPIGSFIFLGPTGVGKTLLAKALAEFIFGSADALIQVDMSEYMEKFNVSRLVGSPPGYIGHGEGGELTERVRRHPYSVVLFDEIEKAHPDVTHMLLQILEEGKLTDAMGRRIDFRNTIIIMTSNIGAEQLVKNSSLGFSGGKSDAADKLKEKLLSAARQFFKPEFLNRVDDVIIFRALNRDDLLKIVNLEVNKVRQRLTFKGMSLDIEDKVLDFLIEKGYQPEFGARPLRRAVEQYLEDAMAEEILKGYFKGADRIAVRLDNNKILFFPEKDGTAITAEEKPAAATGEPLPVPKAAPTRKWTPRKKKTDGDANEK